MIPQSKRAAAVRAIDNVLNARLLAATTNAEARRVWDQKISVKRLLAGVPPDTIPATADRTLRDLQAGA